MRKRLMLRILTECQSADSEATVYVRASLSSYQQSAIGRLIRSIKLFYLRPLLMRENVIIYLSL